MTTDGSMPPPQPALASTTAAVPAYRFPVPPPHPPTAVGLAARAFWQFRTVPVPLRTLLTLGAVAVAGAVLLVTDRLGLGAAVVALLVWVAAVPALVRRRAWSDLVTAALSVSLAAVVAVRDASWVVGLCLVVAAGAGAVAATSARSAPGVLLSPLVWAAGAVRAAVWTGRGVGAVVGTRREQLAATIRSVAVTVVLLVVFGGLFASADRLFASYLPDVDLGTLPARVVAGVLTALVAATLAHLALSPPDLSSVSVRPGRPARAAEWLLPVVALDALVLAFVLVQLQGLVVGHEHVLRTAGLSYAEYARQGFAQLVAATALTLVVVAAAARWAPRRSPRERLLSQASLGVLCVGSLGVVASALRRMSLYVDAFGLTRTRLLAVVGEVALAAILLLVLAAGARWRGAWLPQAIVQVVAVAMLGLALANPDARILRYNVAADSAVAVDTEYLLALSADALPAAAQLPEPLRTCLLTAHSGTSPDEPAGWNLGRHRARDVLERAGPTSTGDAGKHGTALSGACDEPTR